MATTLDTRIRNLERRALPYDPKPLGMLVRLYVVPSDERMEPLPPLPPATDAGFWGHGDRLGDLLRDVLRTAVAGVP